jgi:ADP-heptose:LPS heptosyltransferase
MNILIIKLGALGDVVMATPLIAAIQREHPHDDIHLLTTPPFTPVFAAWSGLQVTAHPRRGLRNSIRTLRWIRHLGPERIYDLQGNDRSALLCAFSRARSRIGNHSRFPYTHYPRQAWAGQSHIFERMVEVLAAAGVHGVEPVPYLPVTTADISAVGKWMEAHRLGRRGFVLLHAGASVSRPEKVWPYFESLGQRLEHHGLRPIWIGAAADAHENERLCAAAGGIDATGVFSIPALAELGRHARFAVTNDSGPMHVLSAAGIPVFGLFGPSDWRRNHAIGQRDHVIACVECVGEFLGARTADCLDRIACGFVWERLERSGLL